MYFQVYRIFKVLLTSYIIVILLSTGVAAAFMKFDHVQLFTAQTGSMMPTFRPGDALLVRHVSATDLKVGQVVSYTSPQDTRIVISHRIIAVNNKGGQLTTRGDNLNKPDTPINQAAVLGRTVAVVPAFGKVLEKLRSPVGLAVGVYLPALVIVVDESKRLSNHYGRGRYRLAGFRNAAHS